MNRLPRSNEQLPSIDINGLLYVCTGHTVQRTRIVFVDVPQRSSWTDVVKANGPGVAHMQINCNAK